MYFMHFSPSCWSLNCDFFCAWTTELSKPRRRVTARCANMSRREHRRLRVLERGPAAGACGAFSGRRRWTQTPWARPRGVTASTRTPRERSVGDTFSRRLPVEQGAPWPEDGKASASSGTAPDRRPGEGARLRGGDGGCAAATEAAGLRLLPTRPSEILCR